MFVIIPPAFRSARTFTIMSALQIITNQNKAIYLKNQIEIPLLKLSHLNAKDAIKTVSPALALFQKIV